MSYLAPQSIAPEYDTWTPVIQGASTAGAGTYNDQVGRYTKIGDIVFLEAYIDWTAHTGTGNLELGGLPFNSANITSLFRPVTIYNLGITLVDDVIQGYILSNAAVIKFVSYPVGGGAVNNVAMDGVGTFMIQASYRTA